MHSTLIDTLSGFITPDLLKGASAAFGESETGTSKALQAAIPAVLAGMLNKTSDHGAMGMLDGLLKNSANDGSVLSNLGSLVGGGAPSPLQQLGGKFLDGIFGSQMGPIAAAIAQMAGVRSSSMTSLLGMAAPIIMSVIGSKMKTSGIGLAALLNGERQSIMAAVPGGLAGVLGALSPASVPHVPTPHAPAHAPATEGGTGWLLPLVGLLVVGGVLWTLMGRMSAPAAPSPSAAPVATTPAPVEPAPLPSTLWPDLGAFARRVLPSGAGELNIPERGIETRLLAFIENAALPVDSTTWFDFDRILFDTGAATLRSESDEQIANIAAILKAFPAVALKIGGYTDNTGAAAANQRLSQARAEAVMQAIVAKGVESARLEAEGYGDQHPVADNGTEEGRQKNRRVSVRVTKT